MGQVLSTTNACIEHGIPVDLEGARKLVEKQIERFGPKIKDVMDPKLKKALGIE